MPGGSSAAIMGIVAVGLFLGVMGLVFGVVVPGFVRASWGKWHAAFPPVPASGGAVTRRYQSFSVGLMNLGFGVHVTVDDAHLHLAPSFYAMGFGMRRVSIPWEAVEISGSFPFGRRRARIAGVGVIGPAWCLDLARGGGGGAE